MLPRVIWIVAAITPGPSVKASSVAAQPALMRLNRSRIRDVCAGARAAPERTPAPSSAGIYWTHGSAPRGLPTKMTLQIPPTAALQSGLFSKVALHGAVGVEHSPPLSCIAEHAVPAAKAEQSPPDLGVEEQVAMNAAEHWAVLGSGMSAEHVPSPAAEQMARSPPLTAEQNGSSPAEAEEQKCWPKADEHSSPFPAEQVPPPPRITEQMRLPIPTSAEDITVPSNAPVDGACLLWPGVVAPTVRCRMTAAPVTPLNSGS